MKTKKDHAKNDSHNRDEEDWIFDPKNKEIVEKIKRALQQKADIHINLDDYDPSSPKATSGSRK